MNTRNLATIVLLFIALACGTQDRPDFEITNDKSEREILSCEICSLKSEMINYEYHLYFARNNNLPQGQIDSISNKKRIIDSTFKSKANSFEKIISYSPAQINNPILKAQYICSNAYLKRVGVLTTPKKFNDFFQKLDDLDTSEFQLAFEYKDSMNFFPMNARIPYIANEFGLQWINIPFEKKVELNYIIQTNLSLFETQKNILKQQYFPLSYQNENINCGPACIKMISEFYGKYQDLDYLENLCRTDTSGTSYTGMTECGSQLGFKSIIHYLNYDNLLKLDKLPLIAEWNSNHYVVVYKTNQDSTWVADPVLGIIQYSRKEFCDSWYFNGKEVSDKGLVITLEPLMTFFVKN